MVEEKQSLDQGDKKPLWKVRCECPMKKNNIVNKHKIEENDAKLIFHLTLKITWNEY